MALAALTLCVGGTARGDEFHSNGVLVGGRAAGMGGAMTGLADDPSSAWYNPAGLSHSVAELLTVNATAFQLRSISFAPFPGGEAQLQSTALLPVASIVTSPLYGGRLAFAGLTIDHDAFRIDRTFTGMDPSFGLSELRLLRDSVDNSYLAGLAWGQDVGGDFDLGIAAYYVFRTWRQNASDLRVMTAPDSSGAVSFERIAARQGISHGILVSAGLLYHPGGEHGTFRLGLCVRSGANVSDSGVADEEQFIGTPAPTEADPRAVRLERRPVASRDDARSRLPPTLAVGLSYRPLPALLFAGETSVQGFEQYESLGRTVEKRAVVNAALGAELELAPVKLRLGGYTNRTSAPKGDLSGADFEPHAWDEYGGTAGLTVGRDRHDLLLAVKAGVLRGTAVLQVAPEAFVTVPLTGYVVSVTAGGSYEF